ncbi:hypothetical protein BOX15_Mlig021470g1 [Macrostomum lignano]|uniref:Serine/threonine-protein phosphatase n=1 Tax=Macrostomum lignano TaxID=282301 RepID=A0A267H7L7_9PLAT|nr:hypothetical protein BOX15_Mlig021470g3 [Macrostomum lignano]PAA94256.1 hypothetical protein BOX15_Mlig021470g1 [Macrostomum lignano]
MSASRKRTDSSSSSSSSSTFDESEDDSDEDVLERRAIREFDSKADQAASALLYAAELPRINNSAARNKPAAAATVLEYTEALNLFNRLHMCGLQQRALPSEFNPTLITSILNTVKPLFCSDASCLQLSSPVVLFGDIHGEFQQLAKLTDILGRPPGRSYLYLGDYVDRGPQSLETLLYLMLMKILHPTTTFVLRGNHEDRRVYRHFNFENDLMRIFGTSQGQSLSGLFATVLAYMPLCAIINGEVFCCHGGLSPHFNHNRFASCQKALVERINTLSKPVLFRRHDFVADLLWSDPLDLSDYQMPNLRALARTVDEWCDQRIRVIESQFGKAGSVSRARSQTSRVSNHSTMALANSENSKEPIATVVDWLPNPRGISYVFSRSALNEFMKRYKINWMVRGHMFVSNGFNESLGGRCMTLFSAADYAQKYHNTAAVLVIEGTTSSSSREFPGRIIQYTKNSLMGFGGSLPVETNRWPREIANRARVNY